MKKLEIDKSLEKKRKRQKKYSTKTPHLIKKQLKERRVAVKERVQKSRERT